MKANTVFAGFSEPKENYYRLPNDWFQTAGLLREKFGERFASPLKTLEYVLRHTWGYQRFGGTVKLTARDIRSGRTVNGRRLDLGTGLSENSVTKASHALNDLGLVEVVYDESDAARRVRSYTPRISTAVDEQFDAEAPFTGFDLPVENYFKVPVRWTDLTRQTNSAACILATEYFFRHGWGYHNHHGIWMEADEVANGRRYVNSTRRYDTGIGFDLSTTYRGLNEAVERGFLVWAERYENSTPRRVFNLRLQGMPVDETGKFTGRLPWEEVDLSPSPICIDEEGIGIVEAGSGTVEETPICIVEEVVCTDEAVDCIVEEVDCTDEATSCIVEARTETGHTLKDTSTHLNQTPTTQDGFADQAIAVVVANPVENFLSAVGVQNPARKRLAQMGLAPNFVLAWALYTWAEDSLDENKVGFLINRLFENDQAPPEPFMRFAELPITIWVELLSARRSWDYSPTVLPAHLRKTGQDWMSIYSASATNRLPSAVIKALEKFSIRTPIDTTLDDDAEDADDQCDSTPDEIVPDGPGLDAWQKLRQHLEFRLGPEGNQILARADEAMPEVVGQKLVLRTTSIVESQYLTVRLGPYIARLLPSLPHLSIDEVAFASGEG